MNWSYELPTLCPEIQKAIMNKNDIFNPLDSQWPNWLQIVYISIWMHNHIYKVNTLLTLIINKIWWYIRALGLGFYDY